MKEKIKWYQEVLELEPGSKVFFPYARCLAQVQEKSRAITLLRQGLTQHPEFLEARLFLAQLLHEEGDSTACEAEVARLAEVLTAYPGFWDAWGQAAEARTPALAFPLAYLATAFRQQSLSLNQLLELGLNAARRGAVPEPPRKQTVRAEPPQEPEVERSSPRAPKVERTRSKGRAGASRAAAPAGSSAAGATGGTSPRDEDDLPVETVSVRTRSMAEVLAEQGDFAEAIAIYQELLTTAGPRDAANFKRRLRELTALADDSGPSSPAATASEPQATSGLAVSEAEAAVDAAAEADAEVVAQVPAEALADAPSQIPAAAQALADSAGAAPASATSVVPTSPSVLTPEVEPGADVAAQSAGTSDFSLSDAAASVSETDTDFAPEPDSAPAPEQETLFASESGSGTVPEPLVEPKPASALENMAERESVSVPEAETAKSPSENSEPPKAPEGMRATLELLAQRLEARAR